MLQARGTLVSICFQRGPELTTQQGQDHRVAAVLFMLQQEELGLSGKSFHRGAPLGCHPPELVARARHPPGACHLCARLVMSKTLKHSQRSFVPQQSPSDIHDSDNAHPYAFVLNTTRCVRLAGVGGCSVKCSYPGKACTNTAQLYRDALETVCSAVLNA